MYRITVERRQLFAEANILENRGPPVQVPGQMQMVAPPNNASNHARRIGHVLGSIDPDSGGPATVVCRLAAAQAALGHHVTIISNLPESARSDFALSTQNIPGFDRVRLLISPWTTPMRRWFGARLLPLYHSLFNYLDVVHIHGVWEPMLLVAASHARKINLPYIVRPCGMLDPWNLESRGWKKKLALSLSHRRMLNGAAILHMLNRDEDRLVASLRLKPRRLVIPNAVFLNEVDDTSGDKEFAALFPQLRDQPYILFLGRLHQKKGLDILIEAFGKIAERHPTLHLLIVGPDGGMRSETLKRCGAASRGEGSSAGGVIWCEKIRGLSPCDLLLFAEPAGRVQFVDYGITCEPHARGDLGGLSLSGGC